MSAIALRHALAEYHHQKTRAWKPRLGDLFVAVPHVCTRNPSATKKGPGRFHRDGYPKLPRRLRGEDEL